jgi:hypothetical protein
VRRGIRWLSVVIGIGGVKQGAALAVVAVIGPGGCPLSASFVLSYLNGYCTNGMSIAHSGHRV